MDGKPRFYTRGDKAGQVRKECFFALAIPKKGESSWKETEWGAQILAKAKLDFPKGHWNKPDFAWKIVDGDSDQLNTKSKKPCDKPGYKGHWVLNLKQPETLPKVYNRDGTSLLTEPGHVNLGDYIQVRVAVKGNQSDNKPGVYLNPLLVAFSGYGERIIVEVESAASLGFGVGEVPSEVKCVPDAALESPKYVMTPKAKGVPYEKYKSAEWTDEELLAEGLMVSV